MTGGIVIRGPLDPPAPGFILPTEVHHVEAYAGDCYPVGIAIVIDQREEARRRNQPPDFVQGSLRLSYVFVLDAFRRKGYGRMLVEACRERWPEITFTGTEEGSAGEALMASMR